MFLTQEEHQTVTNSKRCNYYRGLGQFNKKNIIKSVNTHYSKDGSKRDVNCYPQLMNTA